MLWKKRDVGWGFFIKKKKTKTLLSQMGTCFVQLPSLSEEYSTKTKPGEEEAAAGLI